MVSTFRPQHQLNTHKFAVLSSFRTVDSQNVFKELAVGNVQLSRTHFTALRQFQKLQV